jgi:adenylyl-sulfate kinase
MRRQGEKKEVKKVTPVVVWLTGLPCSGKTTLARTLKKRIGDRALILDGDELREELSPDLGFSAEDRSQHLHRVRAVAQVALRQGYVVLCCFVSPSREVRESLRKKLKKFIEVWVDAPVEECRKRDIKGMWAEAERGERENFTGHDSPYEEPLDPDLHLETKKQSVTHSANEIIALLQENGHV